jgi:hypothetical protein
MASTSPARIDDELYASAKLAGDVQSRSAAQQVAHWARIGREIEASSEISPKAIAAVLAGSRSYDRLSPKEQAVVRAEWAARIDERRTSLNLAERFAAEGRSWVELADDGTVVEQAPETTGAARRRSPSAPRRRSVKPVKSSGAATKSGAGKKPAPRRRRGSTAA